MRGAAAGRGDAPARVQLDRAAGIMSAGRAALPWERLDRMDERNMTRTGKTANR